jgi:hypothetical protein
VLDAGDAVALGEGIAQRVQRAGGARPGIGQREREVLQRPLAVDVGGERVDADGLALGGRDLPQALLEPDEERVSRQG